VAQMDAPLKRRPQEPYMSEESPFWDRRPLSVLHTEIAVDCMMEFLACSPGTLRRLNRCVAEKELYLLQFSAGQMAQPGAGTTQIVRARLVERYHMSNSVPFKAFALTIAS
jgi:hypothetical protein